MKTISINVPDEAFEKTLLITGFEGNTFHGREIDNSEVQTEKKMKSEWTTTGRFGFVTSDVSSLGMLDRLLTLSSILDDAKRNENRE